MNPFCFRRKRGFSFLPVRMVFLFFFFCILKCCLGSLMQEWNACMSMFVNVKVYFLVRTENECCGARVYLQRRSSRPDFNHGQRCRYCHDALDSISARRKGHPSRTCIIHTVAFGSLIFGFFVLLPPCPVSFLSRKSSSHNLFSQQHAWCRGEL